MQGSLQGAIPCLPFWQLMEKQPHGGSVPGNQVYNLWAVRATDHKQREPQVPGQALLSVSPSASVLQTIWNIFVSQNFNKAMLANTSGVGKEEGPHPKPLREATTDDQKGATGRKSPAPD